MKAEHKIKALTSNIHTITVNQQKDKEKVLVERCKFSANSLGESIRSQFLKIVLNEKRYKGVVNLSKATKSKPSESCLTEKKCYIHKFFDCYDAVRSTLPRSNQSKNRL